MMTMDDLGVLTKFLGIDLDGWYNVKLTWKSNPDNTIITGIIPETVIKLLLFTKKDVFSSLTGLCTRGCIAQNWKDLYYLLSEIQFYYEDGDYSYENRLNFVRKQHEELALILNKIMNNKKLKLTVDEFQQKYPVYSSVSNPIDDGKTSVLDINSSNLLNSFNQDERERIRELIRKLDRNFEFANSSFQNDKSDESLVLYFIMEVLDYIKCNHKNEIEKQNYNFLLNLPEELKNSVLINPNKVEIYSYIAELLKEKYGQDQHKIEEILNDGKKELLTDTIPGLEEFHNAISQLNNPDIEQDLNLHCDNVNISHDILSDGGFSYKIESDRCQVKYALEHQTSHRELPNNRLYPSGYSLSYKTLILDQDYCFNITHQMDQSGKNIIVMIIIAIQGNRETTFTYVYDLNTQIGKKQVNNNPKWLYFTNEDEEFQTICQGLEKATSRINKRITSKIANFNNEEVAKTYKK